MAKRAPKKNVLEFSGERTEGLTSGDWRTISASDIARRAYEIYESRGGADGRDMDDWLQAEQELSTGRKQSRGRKV